MEQKGRKIFQNFKYGEQKYLESNIRYIMINS